MDYSTEQSDQSLSKLNSGMLNNLRLNDLWKDANTHSRTGQYAKWNDDLDRVWCELAGDIKEKEKEKEFTEYTKLTIAYAKSFEGVNHKKIGFGQVENVHKVSMTKQKMALMNKEIFLRQLQNRQGKGTAYVSEDDDWE